MDSVKSAKTPEELGKFIKDDIETIEIEGDLRKKVLRIKATGKVSWALVVGAIAVAITSILAAPATGGTSFVANVVTVPVAATVLGGSCTIAAVSIAVAGGGVAALNKLRKYKIISDSNERLIIKKK